MKTEKKIYLQEYQIQILLTEDLQIFLQLPVVVLSDQKGIQINAQKPVLRQLRERFQKAQFH